MDLVPTIFESALAMAASGYAYLLERRDHSIDKQIDEIKSSHIDIQGHVSAIKLDAEKNKLENEKQFVKETTLSRMYDQFGKRFDRIDDKIDLFISRLGEVKHENH